MKKNGEVNGRLKRMHKGYLRLCIAGNLLLAPTVAIYLWAPRKDFDYLPNWQRLGYFVEYLVIVTAIYWVLIRFFLWIYDGFKKEKKRDAINLDSSGKNRNN